VMLAAMGLLGGGNSEMKQRTLPLILAATILCAGCTSATAPSATSPTTPALESSPAASASAPESTLPTGADPVNLDPADFTADITHPYWPMKPGTRWTYRDVDEKGEVQTVVVVATTETKKLANGVTARVVRDTVRSDGELVEDTFDWYAQDSAGNVWYMGEDTAEFENGKIASRDGSF
jgi:ABC-type transport system substrate-binding protein